MDISKIALAAGVLMAALSVASADDLQRPQLLFSYGNTNWENVPADATATRPAPESSYEEQLAISEKARETVVPKILDALEIPADKVGTLTMPGGYKQATFPTFQSSFDADEAVAKRFASAVGYVFRQWSVLVTDFTPNGAGNSAYGVVTFDHALSGAEAKAFFDHAATVNPALGQGFSAFDEEMFFLNLTDSTGKPYGGDSDEKFLADLGKAAESYTAAAAKLTTTGRADAEFIQNDWQKAPDGEDYASTLGEALTARLKCVRAGQEGVALGGC